MTKGNYEQFKKEIIKAVPEIITNKNAQLITFNGKVEYFEQTRPIKLDDILIIIGKKLKNKNRIALTINNFSLVRIANYGDKFQFPKATADWQLNKDLNWHWENKKETVEFLYNLIINK